MKENTKDVLTSLIHAIATVMIIGIIFGCIAWTNSPTDFTFHISMDNNTLEVVEKVAYFTSWSASYAFRNMTSQEICEKLYPDGIFENGYCYYSKEKEDE